MWEWVQRDGNLKELKQMLKVLGHGHVFEARILIFSGSDIIIQI